MGIQGLTGLIEHSRSQVRCCGAGPCEHTGNQPSAAAVEKTTEIQATDGAATAAPIAPKALQKTPKFARATAPQLRGNFGVDDPQDRAPKK